TLSVNQKIGIFAMKITFKTKQLQKLANNYERCQKKMGQRRTDLLNKRLGDLNNANTLEDVRYLPGKYHELKGDRKGEWACNLDHPYRLVFEPHENPIPTNKDGQYIWVKIKGVEILEITDYHGK